MYYGTNEIKASQNKAAPQVPPRNSEDQYIHSKVSNSHSRRPSRIIEEPGEDLNNSPLKNQQCSAIWKMKQGIKGINWCLIMWKCETLKSMSFKIVTIADCVHIK